MGYHTTFNFTFSFPKGTPDDKKRDLFYDIVECIEDESGFALDIHEPNLSAALSDIMLDETDVINILSRVSSDFPDVLFTTHASGENPMDLDVFYAMNGKAYEENIKIVCPKPDLNKLKQ